ncbi:iron dicitrate transport regulator FecR [Phenylobacterium hankyongense]|uniref:Iron dicitrate transport regulator FecR n=1 Tax=Phenylobacterium hankyongense TaxID=1813876 RepID=A0A328AW64_9CAUL|nr:FecR domain-containing protein [Phenylobacterium hankyongense]RAK58421.1 iron dicitrate transport regulator FecR [Phenylobacterium hankyongense]
MTLAPTDDPIATEASQWFAKVRGAELSDADWLALTAWLESDPRHSAAFDALERLWVDLDDAPARNPATATSTVTPLRPRASQAPRRAQRWPWAAGLAAAAALALFFALPDLRSHTDAQTFATGRGQTREITLADGSHIALNAASRISVRLEPRSRRVTLADGEASFQVAHDLDRPFFIHAGDREIRVVGTEFNVEHRGQQLAVTVRRGIVAVGPAQGTGLKEEYRLTARQRLEHREGAAFSTVSWVDPEDAFAWRDGRLVYRHAPLAKVAADLSRRFPKTIRVAPDAAELPFTGVLRLDNEEAVVRRLETFLPVTASHTAAEISLSARPSS